VVLRTVTVSEETPGQWPSMAGSDVMILHSLRAGSPVVTDTGCCPSAAPTAPTRPSGPHTESSALRVSLLRELKGRRPEVRLNRR
jgi:hypothetical protein